MVFQELLAHPDLLASPLAAYQVALELPEIGDYQVHQVMSRTPESFVLTNIFNLSTSFSSCVCKKKRKYFLFTLSPLPFYQCCFTLPCYHCLSLTILQFQRTSLFLLCTSARHHPKECILRLFCLCFCHLSLLPPFFPPSYTPPSLSASILSSFHPYLDVGSFAV